MESGLGFLTTLRLYHTKRASRLQNTRELWYNTIIRGDNDGKSGTFARNKEARRCVVSLQHLSLYHPEGLSAGRPALAGQHGAGLCQKRTRHRAGRYAKLESRRRRRLCFRPRRAACTAPAARRGDGVRKYHFRLGAAGRRGRPLRRKISAAAAKRPPCAAHAPD